ncbi:type I phosphomannose isomerase catalytic subunit [Desnuesiella massiliensis]|uniref:type I phosphomannose isomerase catalytic subunit n=1 Tax=Desnuesiella massiliensis TaxID=1650662 RepID=UPI001FA7BAF7|nr:type I phosphomannose isomerase catalytic subunit [Desnuesiella massiliensis]
MEGTDMMKPIRLKPVNVKALWAGDKLSKLRNLEEGTGIVREVCAYKNSENLILNDEYKDMRLDNLIKLHFKELMGKDTTYQMIRAAYIDAKEDLSIQVHPDDEYAKKIENDFGKSESWYVLECDKNASVIAGCNIDDPELLKEAAINGSIEEYLIRIPVKPGDFVYIPAGLIHACGKGTLVMEIGSFGGITYRMYDYGRGRELHLNKGFEVLDISLRACKKEFSLDSRNKNKIENAIESKEFKVDVIDTIGSQRVCKEDKYHILTCVLNDCNIIIDGEKYGLHYTETLVIPASINEYEIQGDCRVLCSYRP